MSILMDYDVFNALRIYLYISQYVNLYKANPQPSMVGDFYLIRTCLKPNISRAFYSISYYYI